MTESEKTVKRQIEQAEHRADNAYSHLYGIKRTLRTMVDDIDSAINATVRSKETMNGYALLRGTETTLNERRVNVQLNAHVMFLATERIRSHKTKLNAELKEMETFLKLVTDIIN